MKIFIDGLNISKNSAGIGQYGSSLIKTLANRNKNKYEILLQKEISLGYDDISFKVNLDKSYKKILYEQCVLPFRLTNKDIIHFIDYSSPLVGVKIPFIITIHDLSFMKYPETFTLGSRTIKNILAPRGIKNAKKIIVDSINTKRDILSYFPSVLDKIEVIYPAVKGFSQISDINKINSINNKFGVRGKYVLGVGTIEPRKNLSILIEAFLKVKLKNKDLSLVLVGKKGWLYKDLFDSIKKERLEDSIIFTGYISNEELNCVYSGAECFVYPSIYEGFGLPPLEAMNCGTPVIVSNTSSLPEVVGDAGIKINPKDSDELAKSIISIISNLAFKNKLAEMGFKQAQKFSWEIAAEKIENVYDEIMR